MEKLHLGGIFTLAIMKKSKNDHHYVNMCHTEKFQITDPAKVWVSSFMSVNRNGIFALAIMKKLKNGCDCVNICVGYYEKIKKWLPFCKYASYGNILNY